MSYFVIVTDGVRIRETAEFIPHRAASRLTEAYTAVATISIPKIYHLRYELKFRNTPVSYFVALLLGLSEHNA